MTSRTIQSTFKLLGGEEIPGFGLGVWDSPNSVTAKTCLEALKVGYRHIDTAQEYHNEAEVGEAVKKSQLPRESIYVTSKIYEPGSDFDASYQSLLESVRKIDGADGYIDLMLIHSPDPGATAVEQRWKAMEKLHEEGKLKSIGVSNFGVAHIEQMKKYAKVWPPAVNQIELHPWLQQREIVDYCHKNNIVVEAYCPLVRNQKSDDPTLVSIAEKHRVTPQQVLIRYCIEKDWIPLPKSDNRGRIAQNGDVFNFQLDQDDMKQLDDQKQEAALVEAVDNNDTGEGSKA